MRPHPRIRKVVKWGGALVTIACCTIGLWSRRNQLVWNSSADWPCVRIALTKGTICITRKFQERPGDSEYLHAGWQHRPVGDTGWPAIDRGTNWTFQWTADTYEQSLTIPLWTVALSGAIVTALAWRSDYVARRRAKSHACPSCGYDRAGIAPPSPCPECGTPTTVAAPAPPAD